MGPRANKPILFQVLRDQWAGQLVTPGDLTWALKFGDCSDMRQLVAEHPKSVLHGPMYNH